jgi:hypothetical protein
MGITQNIGASSLIKPGVIDNAAARPASPYEGQAVYQKDTDQFLIYNGNAWVCLTPQSAVVNTLESTASTSYTNLTTSGPSVTVATGSKALVTITATIDSNGAVGGTQVYAGFDVSGASTVAAGDNEALNHRLGGSFVTQSGTFLITGLTGGNNVFTMKYKSGAGDVTARYQRRNITVVGIP